MYGDTEVMRRHADRLREQADDIRVLADQLVSRTDALAWAGRAAESLRARVAERAGHLRTAAAQHETAGTALEKHAAEVARLTEAIAEVERRARALLDSAGDDPALARFVPPPSGHRDWLAVELPGL